jgi:hypothetical protein
VDSLIFHSGLSPQPAEVSGEVAALFVRLHSGLISAAALVEDHQKYRELIGDLMPQMEELITDDGPIAAKLHNVLSHLQRGDSFLLQGNLTEAEGSAHPGGLLHAGAGGPSMTGDVELRALAREHGHSIREACTLARWRVHTYYRRRKQFGRVPADFAIDLADRLGLAGAEVLSRLGLI